MPTIDVDSWRAAVAADQATGWCGCRVAAVLARGFGAEGYRISFEKLADEAGVTDVKRVRDAVDRLRRRGWVVADRPAAGAIPAGIAQHYFFSRFSSRFHG
jgi:hypothetical protein